MADTYPAGILRHVADIESFTESGVDGRGQPTGSWGVAMSGVRIGFLPFSGRTAEYAHQLYEIATGVIVMRYRSNVTTANRIVMGSRTFAIGFVENVGEENTWLRVVCSEEVS